MKSACGRRWPGGASGFRGLAPGRWDLIALTRGLRLDGAAAAVARTKEAVDAAFASALHDVTPEDIAGWYRHRAAYGRICRERLAWRLSEGFRRELR